MAAHGYEWKARKPSRELAKQREAVRLREIEGLTFQEIAERLNYQHRASAKKAYEAGVKAGDLDLTDHEHRALLVRRYERLYALAAKKAEAEQDLGALREAGKILDKIARVKQLDIVPVRPGARGPDPDEHDGDDVVVGPSRMDEMRKRRAAEAAQRTAR